MDKLNQYYRVLTIAGSDSGGGAGIQADIKTISALGCYASSVITVLTAQNSTGVSSVFDLPEKFIREQLEAVLSDIQPHAVKIGMLHNEQIIRLVADQLRRYSPPNIVLDPVMISVNGDKLMEKQAVDVLQKELFPLASIVTPNLHEAMVLTGLEGGQLVDLKEIAYTMVALGVKSVLVKGGHLDCEMVKDVYYSEEGQLEITERRRIDTRNLHGAGCVLSAAISCGLAKGLVTYKAVEEGLDFVYQAILNGENVFNGKGVAPVNPFHNPHRVKPSKIYFGS